MRQGKGSESGQRRRGQFGRGTLADVLQGEFRGVGWCQLVFVAGEMPVAVSPRGVILRTMFSRNESLEVVIAVQQQPRDKSRVA